MKVQEAVASRRSVRAYQDRSVERRIVERILEEACRAPSGGNLQPWRIFAMSGTPLNQLKKIMAQRIESGGAPDDPEYQIYPPNLGEPYRERRFRNGEQLYGTLDIPRENKAERLRWLAENYRMFGAPVGLFCYIDRQMGAAQWSDLGMYLQTVMLLLQEQGLASCAQESWSLYHRSVAEIVQPPDELMLFCGMSVGYEDFEAPVNSLKTERAGMESSVVFLGWDENDE